MSRSFGAGLAVFGAAVAATGIVGGRFTALGIGPWYDGLAKPSWTPPGWVIGLGVAVVGLALIGTGYLLMSAAGNVADTGIMEEVNRLIEAAKAAGQALTICEALAQLMAAAETAGDTQRIQRIKATQKAKGCRHSRHS